MVCFLGVIHLTLNTYLQETIFRMIVGAKLKIHVQVCLKKQKFWSSTEIHMCINELNCKKIKKIKRALLCTTLVHWKNTIFTDQVPTIHIFIKYILCCHQNIQVCHTNSEVWWMKRHNLKHHYENKTNIHTFHSVEFRLENAL